MNTCANCIHWRMVEVGSGRSVRGTDATVKNCTANPPRTDFHWPRTAEQHTCGQWSDGKASGMETRIEGAPFIMARPMSEELKEALKSMPAGNIGPMTSTPSPMPAPPRAKRGQAKAEPSQKEML